MIFRLFFIRGTKITSISIEFESTGNSHFSANNKKTYFSLSRSYFKIIFHNFKTSLLIKYFKNWEHDGFFIIETNRSEFNIHFDFIHKKGLQKFANWSFQQKIFEAG